jgi:predicted phage-related endonuclease
MTRVEQKILRAVAQFWADVRNGHEPELDPERDAQTVAAISPVSNGASLDLSGNNELPEKLAHRAALKDVIEDAERECKAIETELKHLLGDAEAATGINGWSISYKSGMRQGYTVPPTTVRPLRITDRREVTKD